MLYCVYIYQTKNIYTNRVACNLHFKYSVPVYLLIHKKFIATLIFCTITASALDAILLIFYVRFSWLFITIPLQNTWQVRINYQKSTFNLKNYIVSMITRFSFYLQNFNIFNYRKRFDFLYVDGKFQNNTFI